MIANRIQLKVSTPMLDAGVQALETCNAVGGHTPRTLCQAVFSAMLAESAWSPAVRKRPVASRAQHQLTEPAERLAYYRGKLIGRYEWQGFNRQDGRHYFRDVTEFPHKWIRITDQQWLADDLSYCISRGLYFVRPRIAVQYLKRKALTLS